MLWAASLLFDNTYFDASFELGKWGIGELGIRHILIFTQLHPFSLIFTRRMFYFH